MGAALEVISLLATAAGAGVSYAGAQESKSAMNSATENEVNSLRSLQKKATPIYDANLDKSSAKSAKTTMDSSIANSLAKYRQLNSLPTGAAPSLAASEPGAKQQDARTLAEVARGQQANAAVQGYGTLGDTWRTGNTNTNAQLGNINSMGQALAAMFPAILNQASQKGASLQGIGSLVGTAGSLLGTANGLGLFKGTPSYNIPANAPQPWELPTTTGMFGRNLQPTLFASPNL